MKNFTIVASILALICVLLSPTTAFAQAVAYAEIRGTITDSKRRGWAWRTDQSDPYRHRASAIDYERLGAYVHDDIRATKTLNLRIGLRWEPSLPEKEVNGRGHHFSLPDFIAGNKTSRYVNAPPGLF
jgi:hypothetical protein